MGAKRPNLETEIIYKFLKGELIDKTCKIEELLKNHISDK